MAKNLVVIGTQWGDEGKGKIVDWLTDHAEGVVRFQGGHNAGHTLVIGQGSSQKEYKLKMLSGTIIPTGTSFKPMMYFPSTITLASQAKAITQPPAGLCPLIAATKGFLNAVIFHV